MKDFVFNSASIPLTEKVSAISKTDELFEALTNYIGSKPEPVFYIDDSCDKLYLSENFSLQDYQDEIITRNRELADFVFEYADRFEQIDISSISQETNLKVGDDTRFSKNISLKFACRNENILFSVSEQPIWNRNKITFSIFENKTVNKFELYNLHSKNIDYLPIELPPFSLEDKNRFQKTNFKHEKQAIYLEKSTGYYWYNDFFHKDNKAHFEVFDSNGNHLGEASMQGVLDTSQKDKTKTIRNVIN